MTSATAKKNGASKSAVQADPPPAEAIEIRPIAAEHIRVPVTGNSPLIISKFAEKARKQMLDAQQGVRTPRENRKPHEEFKAAMYRFADGGYGITTAAFKEATVGAARFYGKNVTMKDMRQFLFFRGEWSDVENMSLIRILRADGNGEQIGDGNSDGDWPRMREDVVRLAGASRSADLRFRPEFTNWTAVLDVIYVTASISRNSVINMIDAGGFGCGVGEWRPERRGDFGVYRVSNTEDIRVVG